MERASRVSTVVVEVHQWAAPPGSHSFFQMGTRSLMRSMASRQPRNAASRCGAEAPTTTARSPTASSPMRWVAASRTPSLASSSMTSRSTARSSAMARAGVVLVVEARHRAPVGRVADHTHEERDAPRRRMCHGGIDLVHGQRRGADLGQRQRAPGHGRQHVHHVARAGLIRGVHEGVVHGQAHAAQQRGEPRVPRPEGRAQLRVGADGAEREVLFGDARQLARAGKYVLISIRHAPEHDRICAMRRALLVLGALLGVAGPPLTLSEVFHAGRGRARLPRAAAGARRAAGAHRHARPAVARARAERVVQRVRHRRVRARHVEARVLRHLSPRAH